MSETPENFANVPPESIDAFVAQAELMVEGSIQLGVAADTKATAFINAFGAIALALVVAAATMMVATDAARFTHLIAACLAAAAILFISVLCFARAAKPADFYIGGYEPSLLAAAATDRTWMLRYVAVSLQHRIGENRASLETSARWMKRGMGFALLAAIAAVAAFVAG